MIFKSKRVLFILKIAVTVTILWIIFSRINLVEVWKTATQINPTLFLMLIAISGLKIVTQSKNWEKCLKLSGSYKPEKGEILKSHFIGLALRFIIPGGHATFGKVFYVNQSKKATAFSVGVERVLQTWSALLFGSWAAVFYYKDSSPLLRLSIAGIVTITPLLVFFASRLLKKDRWKEYFTRFSNIIPYITSSQAIFVFLTVCQYYLLVEFFSDISFATVLMGVPLILLANLIPITYAGLGLRETFSIHIFRSYGVPVEVAVTASLIVYFLNAVLPALIGSYLIFADNRRKKNSTNKT